MVTQVGQNIGISNIEGVGAKLGEGVWAVDF